jgi:hypothetical protein
LEFCSKFKKCSKFEIILNFKNCSKYEKCSDLNNLQFLKILFQFKKIPVPKFVLFYILVSFLKNITKVRIFFKKIKETAKKKKRKILLYLILLGCGPTNCWARSRCAALLLAPTNSVTIAMQLRLHAQSDAELCSTCNLSTSCTLPKSFQGILWTSTISQLSRSDLFLNTGE